MVKDYGLAIAEYEVLENAEELGMKDKVFHLRIIGLILGI